MGHAIHVVCKTRHKKCSFASIIIVAFLTQIFKTIYQFAVEQSPCFYRLNSINQKKHFYEKNNYYSSNNN
jgi:hypothetical protein